MKKEAKIIFMLVLTAIVIGISLFVVVTLNSDSNDDIIELGSVPDEFVINREEPMLRFSNYTLNQSYLTNDTIRLLDENGTVLFEGMMDNESMWNITLTLNMTFKDFINMMIPYNFDYDSQGIINQVAEQLNKTINS